DLIGGVALVVGGGLGVDAGEGVGAAGGVGLDLAGGVGGGPLAAGHQDGLIAGLAAQVDLPLEHHDLGVAFGVGLDGEAGAAYTGDRVLGAHLEAIAAEGAGHLGPQAPQPQPDVGAAPYGVGPDGEAGVGPELEDGPVPELDPHPLAAGDALADVDRVV